MGGRRVLGAEERTNYPVTLSVDDTGAEGFALTAQVQSPVDAALVCESMHTALEEVVSALESGPTMASWRLDVLPRAERRRLLVEWNATEVGYAKERFVHELFEEQVAKEPEAVAVVHEDAEWTYAELNARANRLAHNLRRSGVGPDARVGICVERSVDMVLGVLAILKSGGAYVPLDPAYPAERLEYMVADSAPRLVLTQATVGASTRSALERGGATSMNLESDAHRWASESPDNPAVESVGLGSRHLAYVIYTSGSTGRPKGVMVEHASLSNYVQWARGEYRARDAVVSSSLSFDATVTSLYLPLLSGGTVRLLREHEEVDGLHRLLQRDAGVGLVKLTPAHLDALGSMLSDGACASRDVFVVGGEALSASTIRSWRRIGPNLRVVNEYGPTEAVVGSVTFEVSKDVDVFSRGAHRSTHRERSCLRPRWSRSTGARRRGG